MKFSSQAIQLNLYIFSSSLEKFTNIPLFDSSSFAYIRKRIDVDSFNGLSLVLMKEEGLEDEQNKDEYNC